MHENVNPTICPKSQILVRTKLFVRDIFNLNMHDSHLRRCSSKVPSSLFGGWGTIIFLLVLHVFFAFHFFSVGRGLGEVSNYRSVEHFVSYPLVTLLFSTRCRASYRNILIFQTSCADQNCFLFQFALMSCLVLFV